MTNCLKCGSRLRNKNRLHCYRCDGRYYINIKKRKKELFFILLIGVIWMILMFGFLFVLFLSIFIIGLGYIIWRIKKWFIKINTGGTIKNETRY